jgi:RND family efflux transporter MFP subunit
MKPVEKTSTTDPAVHSGPELDVAPASSSTVRRILLVGGLVLLVVFAVGFVPRLLRNATLRRDAEAARTRLPMVSTATPHRAPEIAEVSLPGTTQGIEETGIYARTDGYLRARYVDLGDEVKSGQLLAEIEAREVDQQLNQALGTLAEAKANAVKLEADLELAKSTLQRYVAAGPGGGVSKQQIDERVSGVTTATKALDAAHATVEANEANVARLRELKSFQRVIAPFDGIITARNVDPGALISSGSGAGAVRELFRMARVDTLRIFVYVPQSWAPDIKPGQEASVLLREFAKQVFAGKVVRTAGALDPSSRTMLAEVQVPNADHRLLAGMYATVRFQVRSADPPLLIPASALLVDAVGVRVAVISDDKLHYRAVQLGRDYGNEIEVVSGLTPGEVVATGLIGNRVDDGASVQVRAPAKNGGEAGAAH